MLVRFRHLVIEDPVGMFAPDELVKVEEELGTTLPTAFTEFLRVAHGGKVEYVFNVGSEEVSFGRMFGVRPPERGRYGHATLLQELRIQRAEMDLPPQALPFARGGGDVRLYLDLTLEGAGRVVAFLEGLPQWTGIMTDQNPARNTVYNRF